MRNIHVSELPTKSYMGALVARTMGGLFQKRFTIQKGIFAYIFFTLERVTARSNFTGGLAHSGSMK